jgi:hypothetical protein
MTVDQIQNKCERIAVSAAEYSVMTNDDCGLKMKSRLIQIPDSERKIAASRRLENGCDYQKSNFA